MLGLLLVLFPLPSLPKVISSLATSHLPAVFRRNLQCEPVRKWTLEMNANKSHAWQHFKRRKGVQLNSIIECIFPTGTEQQSQLNGPNPNTAEPMVKNVHRTVYDCLVAL
jgi:hypothetical protein